MKTKGKIQFKEACEQVKRLANGRYSAVEYTANQHKTGTTLNCRVYIADIGGFEDTTFKKAITELKKQIKENKYATNGKNQT